MNSPGKKSKERDFSSVSKRIGDTLSPILFGVSALAEFLVMWEGPKKIERLDWGGAVGNEATGRTPSCILDLLKPKQKGAPSR